MKDIFIFLFGWFFGILIVKSPLLLLIVLMLDSTKPILAKINGSLFSEFMTLPLNSKKFKLFVCPSKWFEKTKEIKRK